MNKKIYFFLETPLTIRDFHRYGLDIFISSGYSCCIYDFTKLYNEDYLVYKSSGDILQNQTVSISDKKSLVENLKNISNKSFVICHIYPNFKTDFLFENLENFKIKYGFVFMGLIPFSLHSESSNFKKFLSVLSNPIKLVTAVKNIILKNSVKTVVSPYFIMYAGRKVKSYYRFDPSFDTKLIKCNSFDYDTYLMEEKDENERIIKDDYIVFLDEYVPHHPDNLINNNSPNCNPKTYYKYLNNYFNLLETHFKTKVIIAAHPRSEYEKIGNMFNDRIFIRDKTVNLVKFSNFVIAHSSTSISYAILYEKYVNIIFSGDFSMRYKNVITLISKELGIEPLDISKIYPRNNFSEIQKVFGSYSKQNYRNYIEDYMSEQSTPKLMSSEIFLSFLNENELK